MHFQDKNFIDRIRVNLHSTQDEIIISCTSLIIAWVSLRSAGEMSQVATAETIQKANMTSAHDVTL